MFILIIMPAAAHAESTAFTVSIPGFKESWIRDAAKHTNKLTVNAFVGAIEYRMRVVNAETGQIVASGSTVTKGTQLRFEFLPEQMSYVTTGGLSDTPYAHYDVAMPPPIQCLTEERVYYKKGTYDGKPYENQAFVAVYADRPAHAVTNIDALGACSGSGDVRTCTVQNVGTHSLSFNWAQSTAWLYARLNINDQTRHSPPATRWPQRNQCVSLGNMSNSKDFVGGARNEPQTTVTVPAKTIPFTVTVVEDVLPEDGPQNPSVNAAGGACVVGTPYTISMNASHAQNMQIRYLVDWDANGTADQTLPASGYVNAGIAQTAVRTFASAGRKDIAVRAQDTDGALSPWTAFSFTCTDPSSNTADLLGEDGAPTGDGAGAPTPTLNDLSLRALPSLVRLGATTKVHWSSQSMSSCTVTGTNGDSWTGLTSPVSGEISSAITGLTTYTLTCRAGSETFTKTASVNVLPSWVEK